MSSVRTQIIWSSNAIAEPAAAPAPGKARSDGRDTPGASQDHDQLPDEDKGGDCLRHCETPGHMPCAPRARFERATRCLGGTSGPSPDGAGHGLTWCPAAPIVAGCGPAWPHACRCWLPDWLPRISLATLMFEFSNTVVASREGDSSQGLTRQDPSAIISRAFQALGVWPGHRRRVPHACGTGRRLAMPQVAVIALDGYRPCQGAAQPKTGHPVLPPCGLL
jgi:hypothetical protein